MSTSHLAKVLGGQKKAKKRAPSADSLGPAPLSLRPNGLPQRWIGKAPGMDQLTDEEILAAAAAAFKDLTNGKTPVSAGNLPSYVQAVGAQGCGKSMISKHFITELGSEEAWNNTVLFDYDDMMKYHPRAANALNMPDVEGEPTGFGYAFAWYDSGAVTDRYSSVVLRRLLDARYNLVVQSHNLEDILAANTHGYTTTYLYVLASRAVAVRRAEARAAALGRFIPPAIGSWGAQYDRFNARYQSVVPWAALWADRVVVVANDRDGVWPAKADYHVLDSHPRLPPGDSWQLPAQLVADAVAEVVKKLGG